jgi:hypothetical protein
MKGRLTSETDEEPTGIGTGEVVDASKGGGGDTPEDGAAREGLTHAGPLRQDGKRDDCSISIFPCVKSLAVRGIRTEWGVTHIVKRVE